MCTTYSDLSVKSSPTSFDAGKSKKSKFALKSALISGVIATTAMTVFTFVALLMGFEMNIPGMLAGAMGAPVIVGWIAHFMIGIILAIIFAGIFLPVTKQETDFKSGAVYGIFPWIIAQLMVMPMMMVMNGGSFTSGLFSGSIIMAIASLVGHLIYGAVLGKIYKPQTIPVNANS